MRRRLLSGESAGLELSVVGGGGEMMAESKHTPGPWVVKSRATTYDVIGYAGMKVVSTSWHDSIRNPYPLKAEALANAQLASAAPDMLAALKKAREFITNGVDLGFIRMPDPTTPDSAHDTPPMIDAAIAKAEARSNG
jgi:hypothetical protein